jgi:hypothetical protein
VSWGRLARHLEDVHLRSLILLFVFNVVIRVPKSLEGYNYRAEFDKRVSPRLTSYVMVRATVPIDRR